MFETVSFPKLNKLETWVAVNVRTLLLVFFAKSILAFAFSDTYTRSAAGLTAFDARPPAASKPNDKAFPAILSPHPNPLEAPIKTEPAVIGLLYFY